MSTTIGIDLAAQPKETAACVVEWAGDAARIAYLGVGADDRVLLGLIDTHAPAKVAIDAPFGWPAPFLRALTGFSTSGTWPIGEERRSLLFRTTDLVVKATTGRDPLSVSSDRIAICAMRCAGLLAAIRAHAGLDRTGGGLVAEVYPAAALRQWGFDPRGYKGAEPAKVEKRRELVGAVIASAGAWLAVTDEQQVLLAASDHLLDALVSALVGRAVELGRTLPIPEEHRALAASEGWIHLPERRPLSEARLLR